MASASRIVGVAVGLYTCGAVVGALCAALAVVLALIAHEPHNALLALQPSWLLLQCAALGAVVGAVGAPLLAFGLLRRVPLGRAILVTTSATIAGAVFGELIAPLNPYEATWTPGIVRGALVGFVGSGILLRLVSRRMPVEVNDPAV